MDASVLVHKFTLTSTFFYRYHHMQALTLNCYPYTIHVVWDVLRILYLFTLQMSIILDNYYRITYMYWYQAAAVIVQLPPSMHSQDDLLRWNSVRDPRIFLGGSLTCLHRMSTNTFIIELFCMYSMYMNPTYVLWAGKEQQNNNNNIIMYIYYI